MIIDDARQLFNDRLTQATDQLRHEEITFEAWHLSVGDALVYLYLHAVLAGCGEIPPRLREVVDRIAVSTRQLLEPMRHVPPDQLIDQVGVLTGVVYELVDRAQGYAERRPRLPVYPQQGCLWHQHCRCRWEWVPTGREGCWDVYYKVDPQEMCEVCLERALRYNPLRIRNYQVENG